MVCKYCGGDAQGRLDIYLEDECVTCATFWKENPTPPVPPPTGAALINLNQMPCGRCGGTEAPLDQQGMCWHCRL